MLLLYRHNVTVVQITKKYPQKNICNVKTSLECNKEKRNSEDTGLLFKYLKRNKCHYLQLYSIILVIFLWPSDLDWNTIVYCYTVKHKSFPAKSDILDDSKLAIDNSYDGNLPAILMPEDISFGWHFSSSQAATKESPLIKFWKEPQRKKLLDT